MKGISIYLDQELTVEDRNYLLKMRNVDFSGVFTTIETTVPSPVLVKRLHELGKWCQDLGLKLNCEVSKKALLRIDIDPLNATDLASLGASGLRLDSGFNTQEIAALAKDFELYLNASMLRPEDLSGLSSYQANFANLRASFNYYPRPATGLDPEWFKHQAAWLKENHLPVMAFVAGEGRLAGPFKAGRPTLERDRGRNPLAALLELAKLGADEIFVADGQLDESSVQQFEFYKEHGGFLLHLEHAMPELTQKIWHQRPDLASDSVRLAEGRSQQWDLTGPIDERKRGAVTLDQAQMLEYQGELDIMKQTWPAASGIGVINQIKARDLPLLDLVKPNMAIGFCDK
ncbi:MupG family TIM beta-alpha barrel fold protein [Lactobacillus corticis]|uniref:Membrane protein n=1 Tax=Lactobacillus corticis TaxID=2201249 RepID=A0A916VGT1_9LACO|nr:MupG family TIM beta-alpha barrel fold protein [Lactobacillus corticis]GFZ26296.1 membrane protein [Lactobacillus corticis]